MEATSERDRQESHVDEQLQQLEARLVHGQDEVPPRVIHDWIRRAQARFVDARVVSFVPILVERAVRARLRAVAAGRSPLALDTGRDPAEDDPSFSGGAVSLHTWSWDTARRLLPGELPERWAHTRGVARRAEEIAAALPEPDRVVLVATAWLHDVGYASQVIDTGLHQLDGARYLTRHRVPPRVCALVAHHGGAAAVAKQLGLSAALRAYEDERGAVRDALWYCDATISLDGRPVTLEERIAELRHRLEPDDPVLRALPVNHAPCAAACHRTEELLHHAATSPTTH